MVDIIDRLIYSSSPRIKNKAVITKTLLASPSLQYSKRQKQKGLGVSCVTLTVSHGRKTRYTRNQTLHSQATDLQFQFGFPNFWSACVTE